MGSVVQMVRAVPVMVMGAALFASSPARAQTAPTAPGASDPWFGRDKALHFGASAGLAITGYAASSIFFQDRGARLVSGAGLALTAGIAKELNDLAGHGDPSWRDLTWDFVGTAAGLALAYVMDRFVISPLSGNGTGTSTSAPSRNGLGFLLRF